MVDLQLSIKVSPDAYTFNPDSWIPLVRNANPERVKASTGPTPVHDPKTQVDAGNESHVQETEKDVTALDNGQENGESNGNEHLHEKGI